MNNFITSFSRRSAELLVVDSCYYGRSGLVSLLQSRGASVVGMPNLQERLLPREGECRVVLRLPTDPVSALQVVLRLPDVPWRFIACPTLIVLSPFSAGFMLRLFACLKLPCGVQVIDGRLPAEVLCDAVLARLKIAGIGSGLGISVLPMLSAFERRALCESLCAMPAHVQAKKRFVSVKTVYAHRARGLAKLGVSDLSGLIARFGGMRKPCMRVMGYHRLCRRSNGDVVQKI